MKKGIGFWSAVAIGIGGMVGGGIFAVLGLAIELAKGAVAIAFFFAGLIALFTSYSYAKLSLRYPSQGGTVEFLNQGFGTGVFTGGLNILLWFSYLIMLSLYAYAFGSYFCALLSIKSVLVWHLALSGIVLVLTFLNFLGSKAVGKSEELIVLLKLSILFLFIVLGIWFINPQRLSMANWPMPLDIISGGMVIFLAYEGFELIANTAQDITDKRKLPKAFYVSVAIVIAIYVLVSMVTVGTLPYSQIIKARDYALAEAAKPFLGNIGFVLVSIAALLSTASAINATLYGAARISYIIAKDGELPKTLEKKVWNKPLEGLVITCALTLLMANTLNLSSISIVGSAGFLLIFALVNLANLRLRHETKSNALISTLGFILCLGSLMVLLYRSLEISPTGLLVVIAILAASWTIEYVYRRITKREIKPYYR